jgi:hypothetical protein
MMIFFFLNAQNGYFHRLDAKISELCSARANLRPDLDSGGQNLLKKIIVIQTQQQVLNLHHCELVLKR